MASYHFYESKNKDPQSLDSCVRRNDDGVTGIKLADNFLSVDFFKRVMNAKITLELPNSLLQQVKAAVLRGHITMNQFICEALQEKLANMPLTNAGRHRTLIPPPPKIPRKELEDLHKKMLAAAAEIHPDDWK